jgi:hypothetical protein
MDQWLCMPGALIWPPLTGEEHVEQMMQAHKRRKKCPLYVVRNGPPSDNIVDAMSKEVAYLANFLHILPHFWLHYFYVHPNTFLCFWTGQFYRTSIHGR